MPTTILTAPGRMNRHCILNDSWFFSVLRKVSSKFKMPLQDLLPVATGENFQVELQAGSGLSILEVA